MDTRVEHVSLSGRATAEMTSNQCCTPSVERERQCVEEKRCAAELRFYEDNKQRFEEAFQNYSAVADLLEGPPEGHIIRDLIFTVFYKRGIKKAKGIISFAQKTSKSTQKADRDEASYNLALFDKGIKSCDKMLKRALDLTINNEMDARRTPITIIVCLIAFGTVCILIQLPSETPIRLSQLSKAMVALMTAIAGVSTWSVDMENDVLSFLTEDQQKAIKTSKRYRATLLNKQLIKAISIIVLLVAALMVLV